MKRRIGVTKRLILLSAALLIGLMAAISACAEETAEMPRPETGHQPGHTVRRQLRGEPEYLPAFGEEGHILRSVYDLYCEDCQEIVEEEVAVEESPRAAHEWRVEETEPTCAQDGVLRKTCVLCGFSTEELIPPASHQWIEERTEPTCTEEGVLRRTCELCGLETEEALPPAGHQWYEEITEPTCTETGVLRKACALCGFETEEILPPAGHQWREERTEPTCTEDGVLRKTCEICGFETEEILPPTGHQWREERTEPTCEEDGVLRKTCEICGFETEEVLPATGHQWREERTEPTCEDDGVLRKTCEICGFETEEVLPATGHQWTAVSYSEPTCEEIGVAVRQCAVCGLEEKLETPALSHCYVWMDVTSPEGVGMSALTCVLCGDVAETKALHPVDMLYNNTITSFGPTTRELIGGGVWNRVTPIDLSADGVYTYPLIASNLYTVGTATVVIENGIQTVSFRLNSKEIHIHSESLVIYPDLNSLRTGENALSFAFDQPIDTAAVFGGHRVVILGITLKADYNTLADGIQYFIPDESQIEAMIRLIE